MRTILVESGLGAVSLFRPKIESMPNFKITGVFTSSDKVTDDILNNEPDLAIISSGTSGEGVEVGKRLQQIKPNILLVYFMESENNIAEILKLRAVTYLMPPYKMEDFVYAMEAAVLLYERQHRRIYARTFGHFDLFLDGRPVLFKSAKAKELLALLIDRQGGVVDSEQIISILWEGRPKDEATQSLCSKLCKTLYRELKVYGIEDILISFRGCRSINTELVHCDLYEMLEGRKEAAMSYYGEYMKEYAWAEYRNYSLSKYV